MEYQYDEIGFKGTFTKVKTVQFNGLKLVIRGHFLKVVRIKEEDFQDMKEPYKVIEILHDLKSKPDILTFKQRFPNITPCYDFHSEFESIAVLDARNFDNWVKNKINQNSKRAIEKAKKNGVEVRVVNFDRPLIEGMIEIFNESPIRQNRPFWHYGKDYETIEREFSKFLFREIIIGAFWKEKLIGFIFLAFAGNYAVLTQILSKTSHRKLGAVNILLAKAVEICEKRSVPYIVYGNWQDSGLTEFKRRNGFEKVNIPRYYVPLTLKGRIAISLGLHHGLINLLPKQFKLILLGAQSRWHARKKCSKD